MPKIQRALLSCHDKPGIVEFAQLLNEFNVEIISTSGTLALLLFGLIGGASWLGANVPNRASNAVLAGWSALVIVFLYLPIAFVVAHSFNDNKALEVWAGFSTRWYGEMWDNTLLTSSVKSSFGAAAVAAILRRYFSGS